MYVYRLLSLYLQLKYMPDKIDQFVIDVVRRQRIKRKMSQKQLADLLNVGSAFIGNVESPKSRAKFNLSHINQLAKIFTCSPRDFLPKRAL